MEAICSWSNVENFLLSFYLELMGGASENAATAYLAVETQSAKTAMIRAIAKKNLNDDHFSLLSAILAVAKTSQKNRDKLAHHLWGYSLELPEAFLLIDPRVLARINSATDDFRSSTYVYRQRDFTDIIEINDKICGWGLSMKFIIEGHPANRDGRLYRELCEEPEIQEKLGRPAEPT